MIRTLILAAAACFTLAACNQQPAQQQPQQQGGMFPQQQQGGMFPQQPQQPGQYPQQPGQYPQQPGQFQPGGGMPAGGGYPQEVQQAFMSGCQPGETVPGMCACALRKMQAQIPLQQFMELSMAINQGQNHALMGTIQQMEQQCMANPNQ